MCDLLRTTAAVWRDDRAATAIEYAFLAALIAMALVAAMTALGNQVIVPFQQVGVDLTTANTR